MIKRFLQALIVVAVCLASIAAWAVPGLINYQGKLTDPGNSTLTGTYQMVFSLYDAQTGGALLWTEEQSVAVTGGIFHVQLGTAASLPMDVFDSNELYLEVVIDSETLTPRQRITSTAFAMKAADAEVAIDAANAANWTGSGGGTSEAPKVEWANNANSATNANHAATAGDADTVDGKHAGELGSGDGHSLATSV